MVPHSGINAFAGGSAKAICDKFRSLYSPVRIWFGVGCDGMTAKLANNTISKADIAAAIERVARHAVACNAECIVWDMESVGEAHPRAGADFARIAIETTRRVAPQIKQAHTAYDHPVAVPVNEDGWPAKPGERIARYKGGHLRYPWEAWRGANGVDFGMEQTYTSEDPKVMAPAGALRKRQATSARSFELLIKQGLQRENLPWARYNQSWGMRMSQIVNCELSSELWCAWAAPSPRMDKEGEKAVEASILARRMHLDTVEKVKDFQCANGLTADGVIGDNTFSAMKNVYYAK